MMHLLPLALFAAAAPAADEPVVVAYALSQSSCTEGGAYARAEAELAARALLSLQVAGSVVREGTRHELGAGASEHSVSTRVVTYTTNGIIDAALVRYSHSRVGDALVVRAEVKKPKLVPGMAALTVVTSSTRNFVGSNVVRLDRIELVAADGETHLARVAEWTRDRDPKNETSPSSPWSHVESFAKNSATFRWPGEGSMTTRDGKTTLAPIADNDALRAPAAKRAAAFTCPVAKPYERGAVERAGSVEFHDNADAEGAAHLVAWARAMEASVTWDGGRLWPMTAASLRFGKDATPADVSQAATELALLPSAQAHVLQFIARPKP
jgi:hypothetical protein